MVAVFGNAEFHNLLIGVCGEEYGVPCGRCGEIQSAFGHVNGSPINFFVVVESAATDEDAVLHRVDHSAALGTGRVVGVHSFAGKLPDGIVGGVALHADGVSDFIAFVSFEGDFFRGVRIIRGFPHDHR